MYASGRYVKVSDPGGTRENGQIKLKFLLEKSVDNKKVHASNELMIFLTTGTIWLTWDLNSCIAVDMSSTAECNRGKMSGHLNFAGKFGPNLCWCLWPIKIYIYYNFRAILLPKNVAKFLKTSTPLSEEHPPPFCIT